MASEKVVPEMVIDLHGIVEALTTGNNQVKSTVIDSIQSGKMQVVGGVSKELKDLYPDTYQDFQTIKPKKYMHVRVAHETASGVLMESFGAGILGGIPLPERFELLALCLKEGVDLVTAGKSLRDCKSIKKKCSLNGTQVIDVKKLS
ncbi:hypothetical protein [Tropicimonas marinistellae]|uniref:hypothetical protein n=1 Tax=Tropicimonas marinistellae TaxID=1739787 RepID=UPI0008306FC1|nr:hypothetical protein [Tropicimonas marinistellae]